MAPGKLGAACSNEQQLSPAQGPREHGYRAFVGWSECGLWLGYVSRVSSPGYVLDILSKNCTRVPLFIHSEARGTHFSHMSL